VLHNNDVFFVNESKRKEKKNGIDEENLAISDILNVISSQGELHAIGCLKPTT